MKHRMIPGLKRRMYVGWVLLATVMVVLAGCAGGGKAKPASASADRGATGALSQGRLNDGRQGFVITETAKVDGAARNDFERAVVLMNAQDYGAAVELLEKVIKRSPGVTAPYINLAIALGHTDRAAQAEEHLKTALRLVPDHPVACNEYGLLCRKAGRFDEARTFFERALARFPDYYPAHRNLAILCDLYLNDLNCALTHYEMYNQARPGDKQVGIWIADLRNRM